MSQLNLATSVHGRYFLEGSGDAGTLVGFHGYGETAEASLAQLRQIPGAEEWRLVAIQALHPFYTKGGEVVASWMTRQDRELAIADNVGWVAAVLAAIGPASPLVFAGFSQGAAMAARAAARFQPCAGAILLGGDIPPDLLDPEPATLPPSFSGAVYATTGTRTKS